MHANTLLPKRGEITLVKGTEVFSPAEEERTSTARVQRGGTSHQIPNSRGGRVVRGTRTQGRRDIRFG